MRLTWISDHDGGGSLTSKEMNAFAIVQREHEDRCVLTFYGVPSESLDEAKQVAEVVLATLVPKDLRRVVIDSMAELRKQDERWGLEHDAHCHDRGELAEVAAYLARVDPDQLDEQVAPAWAMPLRDKHARRDQLITGIALLMSEIRRLDWRVDLDAPATAGVLEALADAAGAGVGEVREGDLWRCDIYPGQWKAPTSGWGPTKAEARARALMEVARGR